MHSEAISLHSEAISMHSSDRRMSYRTTSEHHLGCLGRLRKRVEGGAHREGRSARKGARQGTHAVREDEDWIFHWKSRQIGSEHVMVYVACHA